MDFLQDFKSAGTFVLHGTNMPAQFLPHGKGKEMNAHE
jgi:hypothetical protein